MTRTGASGRATAVAHIAHPDREGRRVLLQFPLRRSPVQRRLHERTIEVRCSVVRHDRKRAIEQRQRGARTRRAGSERLPACAARRSDPDAALAPTRSERRHRRAGRPAARQAPAPASPAAGPPKVRRRRVRRGIPCSAGRCRTDRARYARPGAAPLGSLCITRARSRRGLAGYPRRSVALRNERSGGGGVRLLRGRIPGLTRPAFAPGPLLRAPQAYARRAAKPMANPLGKPRENDCFSEG